MKTQYAIVQGVKFKYCRLIQSVDGEHYITGDSASSSSH